MINLAPELIEKAKTAASAEELRKVAADSGWEMNEEEANAYFAQLHNTGEVEDDELSDVSGGGCYNKGRLVVTNLHCCDKWVCEKCGTSRWSWRSDLEGGKEKVHSCYGSDWNISCGTCKYMIYNGLQLCDHPDKRK